MKNDRSRPRSFGFLALLVAGAFAVGGAACSSGGASPHAGGTAGNGGATGTAGVTGTAGTTGTAGAGGATSAAGTMGGAGTTGTAGSAGTPGSAGTGGTAGTGGASATAGAGGAPTDGGVDAAAGKPAGDGGTTGDGGAMTFTTTSLKTVDGGLVFPPASSAPMNQSPSFTWANAPAGTLSFAISMYDATAKNTHWILWDIAPDVVLPLPANLPRGMNPTMPAGSMQKSAFGGTPGYEGPGGGGVNNYEIELWALKVAKLTVGTMDLNTMHATLLPAQMLESAKILAKGTRNGL
jgi:phosphatidylethanolamine-binding protein (PEBP) family uncharacterized protein